MQSTIHFRGKFFARCLNPDGSVAWVQSFKNGTTLAGLTNFLNVYLGATAKAATWYLGLIDNAGFSALASADTPASHAGWAEFGDYDEATRQAWVPGTPAGGIIGTATPSSFTMSAGGVLQGAFLINESTKDGTTGTMWAHGLFDSPETVVLGQIVQLGYGCVATGS